jgi:tRNA pseudouridine32 synthase/23S rRNA pseudouridine746 synthase/23S rRNA pseudouridine1911/1915/1917 synthase
MPYIPRVGEWADIRGAGVVLEDEAVLVLNKPAGLSVMGERHDTDLVKLAAAAGEELFPVHRIDKVTSGAVLLARELRWHGPLTRQFAGRTVGKMYLAITAPGGLPARGVIDLPLSAGRKGRVRVAAQRASIVADDAHGTWSVPEPEVFGHVRTYPSVTAFAVVWQDELHALLAVRPVTGRRHQIRVHLAWIGHPVEGDPLFGATDAPRALLHSWRLAFDAAWRGGARMRAEAAPGDDFWAPVLDRLPRRDPAGLLAGAPDPPDPPSPVPRPGAQRPAGPARRRPAGGRRPGRKPPGTPPPR